MVATCSTSFLGTVKNTHMRGLRLCVFSQRKCKIFTGSSEGTIQSSSPRYSHLAVQVSRTSVGRIMGVDLGPLLGLLCVLK